MELTIVLLLSGVIYCIDGTRVDQTTLVDVLFSTFNVRINNPGQCCNMPITCKLRFMYFLDILRNNLIEYRRR